MTATRDKPLAAKSQSIMDFMDEEDLGPAKVGVNIVTSSQFDSFGQNHASTANNLLGDRVFGIDTKDVLGGLGRTNAIGFQMLQRLKDDARQPANAQETASKATTEDDLQTDLGKRPQKEPGLKEEKFYNFSLQASKAFKADFRGLGCDGSTPMNGEDQLEEEFNKHMKRLFNIQDEVNKPKNDPAASNAGKRIMFAASEEDYDGIGGGVSQYSDFVVGENPEEEDLGMPPKASRFEAKSVLDSFHPVDIKLPSLHYDKEAVPKDFTPFRKFEDNTARKKNYTPEERSKLLGERTELGNKEAKDSGKSNEDILHQKTQSFLSKLSDKSKNLLTDQSKFVVAGVQSALGPAGTENKGDAADFFTDESKNDRFRLFILKQEGSMLINIPYPEGFKQRDKDAELQEFARYYDVYQERQERKRLFDSGKEQLLFKIEELKEKIDASKKRRTREEWVPDKVVCIRFGIAQPKHKNPQADGEADFDEKVMPAIQKDLQMSKVGGLDLKAVLDNQTELFEEEPAKKAEDKVLMPDENNIFARQADMDLFDSIFNS